MHANNGGRLWNALCYAFVIPISSHFAIVHNLYKERRSLTEITTAMKPEGGISLTTFSRIIKPLNFLINNVENVWFLFALSLSLSLSLSFPCSCMSPVSSSD